MSWENEVLSLSSSPSPSPSTPERDKHPDVIEENVFRWVGLVSWSVDLLIGWSVNSLVG